MQSREIDLYLIRHGQSLYNEGKTSDPNLLVDCALSEEGRKQAQKITGPVNLLILSPLRRAIETYTYSKLQCRRIIMSDLFREHGTGPWNCLPREDLKWQETGTELETRVQRAIEFLRQQTETHITILSHHDFLVALTQALTQTPRYLRNAECIHLKVSL
jgi:broad specificity phosphatase PhoE